MTEAILEFAHVALTFAILALAVRYGRRYGFAKQRGWKLIIAGFGLILFAGILDVTDEFESLNRFVVIGDTAVQAILEKLAGYMVGFAVLLLGLWLWLPQVAGNTTGVPAPSTTSRLPIMIAMVGGFSVSVAAFLFVKADYETEAQFETNEHGAYNSALVQASIGHHMGILYSVAGLYAASDNVSREELHVFATPFLERNPGLHALEWIPRVVHARRQQFIDGARKRGILEFDLLEIQDDGAIVPARNRKEYFPVHFLESQHEHGFAVGMDLGTDPNWRPQLDLARDTGDTVAISDLAQAPNVDGSTTVFGILPVFSGAGAPATLEERRERLLGYVLGIYDLHAMLSAIGQANDDHVSFSVALVDRSEIAAGNMVYSYVSANSGEPTPVIRLADFGKDFVHSTDIKVADKSWLFLYSALPEKFYERMYLASLAAAIAGLLLTIFVVHFLHSLRDRSREIERIVDERSRELSATNLALEVEMAERQKAEQNLVQLQKMEAMGQLTGGIAHDFNNLLMAIDGYARRAAVKIDEPEVSEACIQEVLKASERANKLTAQLLSFSRRQVMEKRVFRVEQALVDLKGLLRKTVGEEFELRFEIGAHKCCIETDPGEFGQAILNLVINSRDAMPLGGIIIVGAKLVELDESLVAQHPPLEPGEFVKVSVTDYGEGMYPDVAERMFEPFYTTKDQGKGTGLGLAMVYGFAQQSDGAIEVDTSPGVGTTIHIYLPLSEHDPHELTAAVDEDHYGRGETVLLVEDDESLLALTRATLEDLGYSVLSATNGLEALEVDEDHEGEIHMLLSDVVMPSLGGFEMSEIIREHRPDIKIVFMSGYPNRGQTKGRSIPERSEFMQKPILPERLAMVIRKTLDSTRVLATA